MLSAKWGKSTIYLVLQAVRKARDNTTKYPMIYGILKGSSWFAQRFFLLSDRIVNCLCTQSIVIWYLHDLLAQPRPFIPHRNFANSISHFFKTRNQEIVSRVSSFSLAWFIAFSLIACFNQCPSPWDFNTHSLYLPRTCGDCYPHHESKQWQSIFRVCSYRLQVHFHFVCHHLCVLPGLSAALWIPTFPVFIWSLLRPWVPILIQAIILSFRELHVTGLVQKMLCVFLILVTIAAPSSCVY